MFVRCAFRTVFIMRTTGIGWIGKLVGSFVSDSRAENAPQHLRIGRRGENDAYSYLKRAGFVVVARNWRSPRQKGEVDLIAWDGDVLCFVEVKTRTSHDVKPAEAAVDHHKQRELRIMAREYLRRLARRRSTRRWLHGGVHGEGEPVCATPAYRFDVVSVYYASANGNDTDITLFRNAFRLS